MSAVMVCGSREWPSDEWATIYDWLDAFAAMQDGKFVLLHGGAAGPDSWAAEWASTDKRVEEVYLYEPKYDQHGSRAPHVRNDRMLDEATHVIAFWDGKSRGTKSVIDKAQKRGLSYEVHSPAGVYVELATESAPQRTTPFSSSDRCAVLRPPTPEGGAE